jgi:hypothetical protein
MKVLLKTLKTLKIITEFELPFLRLQGMLSGLVGHVLVNLLLATQITPTIKSTQLLR